GCYSMQSCTVECWVKTSNAVKPTAMALDSPDYFLMVTIGIANNKLYLWDQYGTPQATPKSIVSNQWYHLSIYIQWWWTFLQPPAPPGTVSYILQYWVTVNDLNTYTLGRFENGNDIWYPITRLHFSTADIYSGYSSSFDAVGYSWHDDYNVGDNLNTGLLLDFEPDQDDGATGMTYKLDSGPVYSTLGDMVIPLPADGEHTIQVNVTGYDPGTSSFSVDTTP
ncbi:MAG TPA: hypothetical protein VMV49_15045, partial [Candidatus Deferrimicrobium sp.]|nr:hypothetical protein [Candidatus Deferrimicrobium sp.]